MKPSVKATAIYQIAVPTVSTLTRYMAFLDSEPTREDMEKNIGQLEDLEAHLIDLLDIVSKAKVILSPQFKVDVSIGSFGIGGGE